MIHLIKHHEYYVVLFMILNELVPAPMEYWYSIGSSCCISDIIPLDTLLLVFLPWLFHWFLHAVSLLLAFLSLVFHWFLHAAPIPMVFHWFLCIIIDSIGISLLFTLVHATSMVHSIGSFVVIIHSMLIPCSFHAHSMLIPCYATEFKFNVSLKGIPLKSMQEIKLFCILREYNHSWNHMPS